MRATADPGESGSESLATSLTDELKRIRFAIKEMKGTDQWYETSILDLTKPLRGHIDGLIGSRDADTDHDVNTTAGEATDDTGAQLMRLTSEITKRVDATWAVGNDNGGLDTGSIGNTDYYYRWLIMRSDTGVVDVLISLSATSPTMPTNYDFKRFIGFAGLTEGNANMTVDWVQDGDDFLWKVPLADINDNDPGTSAVSNTLTIPPDTPVYADAAYTIKDASIAAATRIVISSLDQTDTAPSSTLHDMEMNHSTNTEFANNSIHKLVKCTTGAVRTRLDNSDAGINVLITTHGWKDRRGRDA